MTIQLYSTASKSLQHVKLIRPRSRCVKIQIVSLESDSQIAARKSRLADLFCPLVYILKKLSKTLGNTTRRTWVESHSLGIKRHELVMHTCRRLTRRPSDCWHQLGAPVPVRLLVCTLLSICVSDLSTAVVQLYSWQLYNVPVHCTFATAVLNILLQ